MGVCLKPTRTNIISLLLRGTCAFAGTKNVIDACIECKVKRLIYTSSPSVVFDGVHGIFNGDETMPYPDKVALEIFTLQYCLPFLFEIFCFSLSF